MSDEDREKTAFSTGNGLWEFNVMPFGLCNAPATFERLMDGVFRNLGMETALVYLDDIIVHGCSFENHLVNLRKVFQRLRQANLKLSPKKCCLMRQNVKYLGHIVSEEGLQTDPSKTEAIRTWPVPKCKKDVRSFLGLASYYRRFVRDFSSIAKPLTELTEEKQKFSWGENQARAFEEIKQHLMSSTVLAFPQSEGEFILDTDASQTGIGGVLSQIQGGTERVLEFYSKTLSKPERNYCVTRKELLAVLRATAHFHHYLFGRPFRIRTDHASLRWLLNFKEPDGQLARWLERLQQYDFVIEHRAGAKHLNADALSRRPCEHCSHCDKKEEQEQERTVHLISVATPNELAATQDRDAVIKLVKEWVQQGEKPSREEVISLSPEVKAFWARWDSLCLVEGVLCVKRHDIDGGLLKVAPRESVNSILEAFHDRPSGGHFGIRKTADKIRERWFWPTLQTDVEIWCAKCHLCNARKGPSRKTRGELQTYNVGAPFERIAIDVLGPLPKTSRGNKYAVVVMDYFTKWPEVFATPDQKAETIADGLVETVLSRYGMPYQLHSDQGRNFEADVFQAVLERLGIEKTRTTALHPQSDGMVERFNRTLLEYLSKFVDMSQTDWDRHLPLALLAYRSATHESTKFSPALLNFGRELRLPPDITYGTLPPNPSASSPVDYVQQLISSLEKVHSLARNHLTLSSYRMKTQYDVRARPLSFAEGDPVWIYNPKRRKGKCPKLQHDWEGPGTILSRLNSVLYRVEFPGGRTKKVLHVDRLARFNTDNKSVNKLCLVGEVNVAPWEEYSKGFASKILERYGFEPGKGLGKDLQGISNPIRIQARNFRSGLGTI